MDYFCLTTPQKNIWNLQKYYGDTAIGNQCGAIFYKEKRDIKLLKEAIRIFIENQSGMRLRFVDKEEPLQYVSGEIEEIQTKIFTSMDEFEKYAQKFAKEPIGLNDKAMYRFVVFQVKDRSGVLVALSHLISDAWTFGIMANQVDAAYRNLAGEKDCELTDGDYAEYIKADNDYLHSDRYAKDKAFWEGKYAGRPEKGVIRLASGKSDNIEAKRISKRLSDDVENKIDKYCKEYSVTPAVLFETALVLYLSHINLDNNFITIGIPVLNRNNVKEKRIAGMFVSTMPLTVEIKKNMTVSELAQQISKEHMNIFRHQKYPYSDILTSLREKQNFSGNLYDVMISYQNARTDTTAETKWYSNGYSEVPFTIHIDNRDDNMSHTINVDYQTAIFKDEREVEYIIERLEYILCQITDGGDNDIKNIKILPHAEAHETVEKFNDTYVEYPREKCVHELFTEQAKKTPDKIALVAGNKKYTYREIDKKSDALAQKLINSGVEKQNVVGAYLDRTANTVISQLAVLKAGGVFLPIDHRYPKDRINYMLNDCSVKLVICDKDLNSEWNVQYLNLNNYDFNDILQVKVISNREDACYIIYTSGSTGNPKGCVLKHKGLANFCANNNIIPYAKTLQHQTVVSVNTISFDFFIAETLLPLSHGWTVVLASEEESNNRELFRTLVEGNNVNIIETTPTRLELYTKEETGKDSYFQKIQLVVSSGEALSEVLLQKIRHISRAKVYNPLGPSECSVWNVDGDFKNDITIGSPIANTQIYILDKSGSPLPICVPGELCIAGDGVGGGYLNRPELTAEKFVPNPFATEENHHGKIMYHTGDLACWRADGEIEYLGRIDTQVKIRGLRIELGEIENVMSGFPGIRLTAVSDKRDENNRQYLVGYYTSEQEIDEKELRSHLASKLPKYMVPNYFMRLDDMPMTASGKTDRKNLPVPDFTTQEREYIAPETDTEQKLADIWSRLLNIDEIGRTDDFFECGGDSLIAISMLTEIENYFDVEISIKDVMEKPVLNKLAQCIEKAGKKLKIKANNKNTYKLMPQQKALYVTYSKEPFALTYNMPAKIHVPDEIDINKLKDAITKAAGHHRILFSHIESDGQELIGVYDAVDELVFEQYNENEINKFVRPFDLSKAPLVRVGIAGNEILFDMHHIVADGETMNILLRDIIKEYDGIDVNDEKVTYGDYSEFFYKQDMAVHKEYFKEQLKCDFEPVVLPATKNPIEKGFSKAYEIAENVVSAAKKYARKNNMTDTMIFWAAYGILLSKYSGNNSVLSSIVLKNRIYADTKDMAGMFVNTIPVHIDVTGSVCNYMQNIKKQILGLFEHQEMPFALISDAVGMKDKNVINTSFVYQADGEKSFTIGGEKIVPEQLATDTSKFDLMMELTPVKDGLRIRMEFDGTKYDENLIDRLVDSYTRILGRLDKTNLSEIEVMSSEEYHKVIEEFNDTYVEYPREKCVHELFTEQAKRTPDKIALVFEDEKFTYKQLDEMTNSLAHYLREKGVKRNDIVPIIAKRSWHVIVAMLGIMKAGGAYMPVDPDYPDERIEYMLIETKSKIILSFGYTGKIKSIRLITLEKFDYTVENAEIENINESNDDCYVLFTSGSTGKPKAVIVSHSNLGNFINNNNNNKYQCNMVNNCKNVLADTAFTFDISVFEIYLTLLNGMTVILSKDTANASYLAELIDKYDIDVFHCTPTKILILLQNGKFQKAFSKIKMVMIGAENFSEELYKTIVACTNATIYNGYGPTETTIGCSFKKLNNTKKCVHELFTEQAKRTPDKIALVAGNKKYSYREIDKKSDALAQKLINSGVEKQNVVGAYLDRTANTVISQLAVLKAGGVFLPIDHRYPKDRINYMLNDCSVKLVICDKDLNSEWNVQYLNLNNYDFNDILQVKVISNREDACYIIYTSGSTGNPKGCVLKHKGLANFCANNNIIPYAKTLQHQTVVSVNTISFDFFIAETLLPLSHGWTVVLASEEESNNRELFRTLVEGNNVNIIETTPTRLELYTKEETGKDSYFQKIQLVVSSGEALSEVLLQKIRHISRAKVYNPLGPSECSVWNVDGDFKNDITIGSPIANTQIYILDKSGSPLPICVPGELCIAGDGVGGGYLNRPELTAEKFVPNPFATEENHHGKIMYHTGDLACWRADGEIEYLGRIDTQVKIRGLRIELGEIENVMSGFPGIRLTAVSDKRDENNRQYLVGYYTSEQEIDEKELRSHLASKLPKYMVPNYFMRLDDMPMTASGKTDRKNLPVPDFTTQEREYAAPETDTEQKLCELLKSLLHMNKVGIEDDFFEYGGDSLTAIEYVAKADDMGIEFSLQNVFDYPTVRELCNFLNGTLKSEKVQYEKSELDKYNEILGRNIVDESAQFHKKSLGNILITGATGFLGAHVVDELMKEEQGKIYCLVRGKNDNAGRDRLKSVLEYYFGDKYESEIDRRIIPVCGDIEEPLPDGLPSDVQTVIHTAASVKHYGSYSYFQRVNAEGTGHVVEYAKRIGAKLIHISTLSVSGNSMADDFTVYHSEKEKFFDETSFYIGQPLDNVYIHSKFEAERKVYDAMLEGLDAIVIRVGNLTNRASDYKFQPNFRENAFLTRVKAVLEFGLFPDYLMSLYSEFSPIDKTAEGIVKIAQYADNQSVFHLNSNKEIYFERFLDIVHELGISMKVVNKKEFNEALKSTVKQRNTEYIYEAFQNDMDEKGCLVYDSNIRIENDFTLWFLKKAGFEWNETDIDYIRGYIDYFRSIGYLEV